MTDAINSWIFSLGFPGDMLLIAGIALVLSALSMLFKRTDFGGSSVLFILFFASGWYFRTEGILLALLTVIIGEVKSREGPAGLSRMLGKYTCAIAAACLYFFFPGAGIFPCVFLATLSEVAADRAGCNIGFLSADLPISLSTRLPVKKGEPGGVSVLGILASLGASFLLALFFIGTGRVSVVGAGVAVFASFAGTIIDSWLGGSVECYGNRGVPWLDNSMVDFMASVATTAIASGLAAIVL